METKEQLLQKLRKLEEAEKKEQDKKRREQNYKDFKNRKSDWVIGLAHADIDLHYDVWSEKWEKQTHFIDDCITINGNCGKSYFPQVNVTSMTHTLLDDIFNKMNVKFEYQKKYEIKIDKDITFFHNVWTYKQREQFQKKLNKMAFKEIQKIMSDLTCTLELLGLQQDSNKYYISQLYPEDKADEIRNEIWKETCKVLDKYKDSEFKKLLKKEICADIETGEKETNYSVRLDCLNSKCILERYIKEHRKNLLKFFEPVFNKN